MIVSNCDDCPLGYIDEDSYGVEYFLICAHPDYRDIIRSGGTYRDVENLPLPILCPLKRGAITIELLEHTTFIGEGE